MSSTINLIYIRAAIEANTGFRLSLERVRELLVEEGLIKQQQADSDAVIFTGYHEFFYDEPHSDLLDEDPSDLRHDIEKELKLMENSR